MQPSTSSGTLGRHLWQYQPVRDGLWLALVLAAGATAYSARAVTLPVVLSLAGAYALNPFVTWCDQRLGVRRWVTSGALLAFGALGAVAAGLYVVPKLVRQVIMFARRLPGYVEYVAEYLQIDWEGLALQAEQALVEQNGSGSAGQLSNIATNFDVKAALAFVARSLGVGIDLVGSMVGWATYAAVAVVVFSFCFICFSTQFAAIIDWFGKFIPSEQRGTVHHTLGRMDRAVSAFLRGRLIQATVMAVVLTAGWWAAGVPYWLLLGLVAGVLSFVPYAASVGWLLAVVVTWVDRVTGGSGFSLWAVVVWPTAVYAVAQLLDGWVVEPIVQGKATDLDPLTVLLAVLIGGSLMGVVGLVLAIPVAACIKILAQEWLLPRLRQSVAEARAG